MLLHAEAGEVTANSSAEFGTKGSYCRLIQLGQKKGERGEEKACGQTIFKSVTVLGSSRAILHLRLPLNLPGGEKDGLTSNNG